MKLYKTFFQRHIIALFSLVLLASCQEKVDIKLNNTYVRLVVEGSITTDTTAHQVILTKSGDVQNQQPRQFISNALVTITDGTSVFALNESKTKPGVYQTDSSVYGIPGKTYTLNISNVDVNGDGIMETYAASSYLPKENPIDSISVEFSHSDPHDKSWFINLYALEIGGGRNFYLMKVYKNDTLLTDSTFEYVNVADNTGFEGKYYSGFPVYTLSYDKADERIKKGDIITLEMDGITQEYEKFIIGFITEYYPKIPIFSGPSANIPTNIIPTDKAVGFFSAYSAVRKSIVYNGE